MYSLQPEKKSFGWHKILAIGTGIALSVFSCAFFALPLLIPASVSGSSTSRDVSYKIYLRETNPQSSDGCADLDAIYEMPGGTRDDSFHACEGYTLVRKFKANRGDQVSLSIQNNMPESAALRFECVIDVDGRRIAITQAAGLASIASCSGVLE